MEMESESKKAVESLDIIKQVLNKTRCDIVEIADFFIIIGIINFSLVFFDLFLASPLAQKLISFLTDDLKLSMFMTFKYFLELSMGITIVWILIQVFVWIHYNNLIKKKKNQISSAILQFMALTILILPLILAVVKLYTGLSGLRISQLIDLNEFNIEAGLWNLMDKNYLLGNSSTILVITSIFLVGILLQKKSILILDIVLIILFFAFEFVALFSNVFDSYIRTSATDYVWGIIYSSINYVGYLGLGIILKIEGRKTIDGIE